MGEVLADPELGAWEVWGRGRGRGYCRLPSSIGQSLQKTDAQDLQKWGSRRA